MRKFRDCSHFKRSLSFIFSLNALIEIIDIHESMNKKNQAETKRIIKIKEDPAFFMNYLES